VFNETSVLLLLGLILSVHHLSSRLFHHSSWSSFFSKWRDNPSSSISFLHPFLCLSSFCTTFPFPLYVIMLFFYFGFHLSFFILCSFHFASYLYHHNHQICVFSLCPLEVNLHTYLTTWLSSCLMGIFFGFSP